MDMKKVQNDKHSIENIDIFSLDKQIKSSFQTQKINIDNLRAQLKYIKSTLNNLPNNNFTRTSLLNEYTTLKNKIYDVENDISLNLYLIESQPFLNKYTEFIKKPVKFDFLTNEVTTNGNNWEIQEQYLIIFYKYKPVTLEINIKQNDAISTNLNNECEKCSSKIFDIVDDNIEVCVNCGNYQTAIIHTNITERVNVSSKYSYERISHFIKCVNQYQGKQNTKIPNIVYTKLENYFVHNELLLGNKNTVKSERYKKISKQDVYEGLKENNLSKYYNDIFLLHHQITGYPRNNLSHIESSLFKDFETLSNLYDEKYKNEIVRSSFLNGKYILYHLLKNYKYQCDDLLFLMLKTHERRTFYNDICRKLFASLNWNFESAF